MVNHVYVLRLEDNCWYVGSSSDWKKRVQAHTRGEGAEWTRLHKPIECVSHKPGNSLAEESKTLELMSEKGVENVRGGSYASVVLSTSQVENLRRQISSIRGECYKCGSDDHMVADCLDGEYCTMCSCQYKKEIVGLYGKVGQYYAGDDCYIPCPGCG